MAKIKNPTTVVKISDKFKSLVDRSITTVTAEDLTGVTTIGPHAFFYCPITSIEIPNSVTTIDSSAFQACRSLASLTIPASVSQILNYAFLGCIRLSSITVLRETPPVLHGAEAFTDTNNCPIYVKAASVDAYKEATNWSTLSDRIFAIPSLAFTSNGDGTCYVSGIGTITDTDVVIPSTSPDGDTVVAIGANAFRSNTGLTSIAIPDSITNIGGGAFENCSNLTTVTFGENIQLNSIGSEAFYGCTSLTNIVFPAHIAHIGDRSFQYCSSLTNIIIPSDIIDIEEYAFNNCTSLIGITILADTPPTLDNSNAFGSTNNCPISVPAASVDAYKEATNWSDLSDRIFPI